MELLQELLPNSLTSYPTIYNNHSPATAPHLSPQPIYSTPSSQIIPTPVTPQSEALSCAISSPFSHTFNISLFYLTTSPNINSFLDKFSLFIPTITSNTIILGDFNIPTYDPVLKKLLTSFKLVQHVTSPTHVHVNTLNIIIFPKTNKIVTDHSIGPIFSDHYLIFIALR